MYCNTICHTKIFTESTLLNLGIQIFSLEMYLKNKNILFLNIMHSLNIIEASYINLGFSIHEVKYLDII